jgi:anti-sigma factor RsiW
MNDTASCPNDELLIGYVTGDLAGPEQRQINDHVSTCDRCIETARAVHARLRVTSEPLESPPAVLRGRVHAANGERRPVPLLLRLPILVPMSLAAGALLVVGVETWVGPARPPVLIRAVQIQRTTHGTPVHAQPSEHAPVVASLNAGESVEVRSEQPGWYRVTLADGSEGWIEARAFE